MKTYGLLGKNISYSKSPVMHNAAFKHYGIPAKYVIFDKQEDELEDFLRESVLSGEVIGFNVTVPHKIRIQELLENCALLEVSRADEWVALTKSVNTVNLEGNKALVYNTDVVGFGKSLKEDTGYSIEDSGKDIFLFGAGGAGRALCIYLASIKKSGKINVFDLDQGSLDSLEEFFKTSSIDSGAYCPIRLQEEIAGKIEGCDLVVNATPLGTKEGDAAPLSLDLLKEGMAVYDLVYARETELIKYAKGKGLAASNGLNMLINQGAKAFEYWTGKPFEETQKVMKEALG